MAVAVMTATTLPRLFFTPAEASIEVGCSAEMVRRMIKNGEIRAERRGSHFKIPRAEVERLAGRRLTPSEEEREREAIIRELRMTAARFEELLAKL